MDNAKQVTDPQSGLVVDANTSLSAERTLLAWIRTGLALMGFGFVVARFGLFLRELVAVQHAAPQVGTSLSVWFGAGMMMLGVAALGVAGSNHVRLIRSLAAGKPYRVRPISTGVILTILLAILGLAMTGFVVTSLR